MHPTLLSCSFIYFSVAFSHQLKSSSAANLETELCTAKYLMPTDDNAIKTMADMISPLGADSFFANGYEQQSTAILNRPPGYYSSLIHLGVIIDYLRAQGRPRKTSKLSGSQRLAETRSGIASLEDSKIEHGGDWKLIKRVWRNGDWWSSSPNMSTIPFEVVIASFQRHGYSILINKIQNFHSPIKKVTTVLESLLGHRVNANLYLTPYGINQAFETHFDWMDGIILQITGCKHWKVYDTPLAVRPLPDTVFKITTRNLQPITIKETDSNEQGGRGHYDEDKDDEYVTNEERKNTKNHIAPRSRTLKPKVYEMAPGSLLYIPRGFAHEAATNCSSSSHSRDSSESFDDSEEFAPSLHVTFGLETATDTTVEIFIHHYIDILAKHHYPAPTIKKFSYEVPPIKGNISSRSSRIVKESSDSIRSYTVVDSSSYTVTIKEQEDETCVKNSDNQTHSQNATNSSVRILKVLKERINDIGDLEVSADGNEMIIKDDKDAKNFVNLDMNVTEFRKKTSDKEEEGNRAHSGEQSSTSSKHLPLSITLISASSDLAVQMDNISLFDIFHVIVHVATTIDKDLYNCQEHSTTISSNLKDCKRLHEFMTYLEKKKNKKEKFRESPKKNKKRKVTAKSIADDSLELSACPSILRRAVAVTKYTANSGYQPMIYDLIPDTVQYLKQFISFYGLPDILQKTLILGLNMGKISINLGNIDFSNNTVTVNKTRGITSNRNSNSIMLQGLNYVKYFISSSSTVHITSGSDIPYVQGMEDRIQGKNQDEYVVAWFQNTLLQTSWGSILVTDGEQKEVDILNLFELFFDDLRNEIGNVEIRPKRDKNGDKGKMDLKTSEIIDVKIRAAEEDEGVSTVSHAYCAAWKEMTHRLEYRRSFREGTG